MLAEIWTYTVALLSNWASLIWGTSLIFDVGGLVLRKNQYLSISNWLDQYVAEEIRVTVLRTLLVIGLLIASFNAWDEQYHLVQSGLSSGDNLWQALTDRQVETITNEIKGKTHSYRILYNCTDNCGVIVDEIDGALQQARWANPSVPILAPTWNLGKGIFVDQVTNDGGADALVTALKQAHLPAERKPMGGTVGSPFITIFVGERPSP
jgi:hypothetical protein